MEASTTPDAMTSSYCCSGAFHQKLFFLASCLFCRSTIVVFCRIDLHTARAVRAGTAPLSTTRDKTSNPLYASIREPTPPCAGDTISRALHSARSETLGRERVTPLAGLHARVEFEAAWLPPATTNLGTSLSPSCDSRSKAREHCKTWGSRDARSSQCPKMATSKHELRSIDVFVCEVRRRDRPFTRCRHVYRLKNTIFKGCWHWAWENDDCTRLCKACNCNISADDQRIRLLRCCHAEFEIGQLVGSDCQSCRRPLPCKLQASCR